MQTSCRKYALSGLLAVAVLVLGSQLALSQWGPPTMIFDQNKLYWDSQHGNGYILGFNDLDGDTWHDAGEALIAGWPPSGWRWRSDWSCWMASASNLLYYNCWIGYPYDDLVNGCLQTGSADSPALSPWGVSCTAGGGDNRMTFDDGGWQEWLLKDVGAWGSESGHIRTGEEFGTPEEWIGDEGQSVEDPAGWCWDKLYNRNQPVALTCWWSRPGRDAPDIRMPGPYAEDMRSGYHAITLWDIRPGFWWSSWEMTITDSDDEGILGQPSIGPREVIGWCYGIQQWPDPVLWTWLIEDLYPDVSANVNYAVCLDRAGPTKTEGTTWGGVKSLFR